MAATRQRLTSKSSVASHLIRFVGLNVCLAFLPLVASVIVRQLAEVPAPPGVYAPELLFFSVAISATALGDLTDEKYTEGIKWLFDLLKVVLILGVAAAALLFGFYQYDAIIGSSNDKIRNNITPLSIWVAGSMFAVSFVSETIIAQGRGNRP